MKHVSSILISLVALLMVAVPAGGVTPTQKGNAKTQTSRNAAGAKSSKGKNAASSTGRNSAKSQGKKSGSGGSTSSKSGTSGKKSTASSKGKRGASQARPETSAELQRRQEDAQKEIRLTRQQIEENDAAVKKSLGELSRLGADIDAGKKKVADASARVKTLTDRINELSGQIAENEAALERLRGEYLKAIKKIRAKKKTNSELAFIFSSSNFNEALRRMRYLKQFGEWRDRQSAQIGERVAQLRKQTSQLEASKTAQSKALATQVKAQEELQGQYARQDAIVADLKKNGQALQAHLANKQQEANTLKQRVAALIAEEQRKAEAARKAEEERQARLESERRAREESERLARIEEEKAAAAREAGGKENSGDALVAQRPSTPEKDLPSVGGTSKKKEKKPHKTEASNEGKNTSLASSERKRKDSKKEKSSGKAPSPSKSSSKAAKEQSSTDFADARKRKPRGSGNSAGSAPAPTSTAQTPSSGGKTFESMRGSLPRPVSGHFRITGRFGRHSLPDLPDVVYDNPGIDAETAAGASAQAVFGGKVSGVYMIPGFSTVVIVNHGNYYTVYGNIASAAVKVGDVVKQGQALGQVAQSEDDSAHGSIHFEVWKNRDKLDPASWIR